MPSDDTAVARMVSKYQGLISDFVSGRLSAQSFESTYLRIFKNDTDQVPGREFGVLEKLFFAVDDYVANPDLREKVGGQNDDELRARAAEAQSRLFGN